MIYRGKECGVEVRTDFKHVSLGTFSGLEFSATVEEGSRTIRAKFILPTSILELDDLEPILEQSVWLTPMDAFRFVPQADEDEADQNSTRWN